MHSNCRAMAYGLAFKKAALSHAPFAVTLSP